MVAGSLKNDKSNNSNKRDSLDFLCSISTSRSRTDLLKNYNVMTEALQKLSLRTKKYVGVVNISIEDFARTKQNTISSFQCRLRKSLSMCRFAD